MKVKSQKWFLVVAAAFAVFSGCAKQEEVAPKPVVAVKTTPAEVATVELSLQAPATIFPQEQANLSARITAPIREMKVKKGDDVEASEVLVVLEDRDALAQQQEARAALAEAQANLERTSAGTLPTDIERSRGQLETAEAALNLAQKVYDRRAELFKQGAIPQRDLLQSETELAQAKTNEAVARRSLDLLQRQSGQQDLAIARSRVEQARARLEQANAQLQYTEIRSPFAGFVTEQFLYPGDMAKPDSPIFTVMGLSVVTARAQVPESQVSVVHAGQSCEFHPSDTSIGTAGGKVTVINRAVDAQRRTVETWCEIPNTGRKLRAAAFGQVRIRTGTSNGLLVPQAAVQFAEGTHSGTVMVVDDKKIAHKREIEAGETLDGKVQIVKGLKPGETVIVEGGYGLPDGTEVTTEGASK